jgi:hypothetical protein
MWDRFPEAENSMAQEKVVSLRARKDRVKNMLSKRNPQLEGPPGGAGECESSELPIFEEILPVSESEFLDMAARFEQKLKQYNFLTGEVPYLLCLAQQAIDRRKFPAATGYFNLIKDNIMKTPHKINQPGFDPTRDLDPFVPVLEKVKQDEENRE